MEREIVCLPALPEVFSDDQGKQYNRVHNTSDLKYSLQWNEHTMVCLLPMSAVLSDDLPSFSPAHTINYCSTDFLTGFFYMENNIPFTFLEKSRFKLKAYCACIGTHATHDMRSAGLKKLFHVSNYCTGPGVGHSNG